MTKRCGCATNDCSCSFTAGAGIALTSDDDGVTVDRTASRTAIQAISTDTIELSISGDGSADNPFILEGETITSTADFPIATQIIFTDSEWVKPTGKNFVEVVLIGGGAGGMRGWAGSGDFTNGGTGGSGGAFSRHLFRSSDVPATVNVTVGGGGVGGTLAAGNGNAGGDTRFGDLLLAQGGANSTTVRTFVNAIMALGLPEIVPPFNLGTEQGQWQVGNATPVYTHPRTRSGGAGGNGGGNDSFVTDDIDHPATAGGGALVVGIAGGAAGVYSGSAANGAVGGFGASITGSRIAGGSGGGGGAAPGTSNGNGGWGGNGGWPGGGGGGGGRKGIANSGNFGLGGAGANGVAIIKSY